MSLCARPLVRFAVLGLFLLALVGGATANLVVAQSTPQASPAASPIASPGASPVADPLAAFAETPVGAQALYVLGVLNGEVPEFSASEYEARFAPVFTQALPFDQFLDFAAELSVGAPWVPIEIGPDATETTATVTIQGTGNAYALQIAVDDTAEHRITGLLVEPAAPASWEEVDAALSTFGPTVSLVAAELTGTTCAPVHGLNPNASLAIGSAFKLYILGELGRQIAAGERTWDDPIEIQDAYRSLPSGDLRYAPTGSTYTLRYLADVMISQSDNTATDHLLFTLGRENVEAMVTTMGHADASLMTPFLSTRELFAIKIMLPEDRQQAYVNGSADERRAMLDGEVAEAANAMTLADAGAFVAPILNDSVEWFASPTDLCAAMAYLADASNQPGMLALREALILNPGYLIDRTVWPVVGFKGGSEPGVLTVTWLLQRADGRWFVLSAGVNDPENPIQEQAFVQAAAGALAPLAQTP